MMSAMAPATLDHARSITADVVREMDPLCVVLFGAVAREGSGSDVDLLIVVDDDAATEGGTADRRLRHIVTEHSRRVAVDPLLIGSSAFRDRFRGGSPLLNAIVRGGRQLYMRDAQVLWAKDARDELDAARFLATGRYVRAACYHAQQAVEKSLKGRLLSKGWELEKVHSIARLVSLCGDYGIPVRLAEDEVAYIDSIYRGRCPGTYGGGCAQGDPHRGDGGVVARGPRREEDDDAGWGRFRRAGTYRATYKPVSFTAGGLRFRSARLRDRASFRPRGTRSRMPRRGTALR